MSKGYGDMYTEEQVTKALAVYKETTSITKTITQLGYPSRRQTLYNWIKRKPLLPENRYTFCGVNTPEHPRHPSVNFKLEILHRCFELGENVQDVSSEVGYSTASIYQWRKKFLQKGVVALMNPSNERPRGPLFPGKLSIDSEAFDEMKTKLQDMQLELDILRETIHVLKKDQGVELTPLRNREKAVIIDALKSKYSLPILLKSLDMANSSYYYQKQAMCYKDKYQSIRECIKKYFIEYKERYGYRRIHCLLKRDGLILSEKVVRRIMLEEGLIVKVRCHKKYNSYQGEISPEVENLIQRNFHADKPNQKWLTDITEFSISAGKIYLSAIVDCFDGFLPSWTISTRPDAKLVNDMLEAGIQQLKPADHPIIHTDRGCHYRWSGWVKRMENAGLIRSMSKKGCSPDNAACEGFWGLLKKEMFYNQDWTNISIKGFIHVLNDYLDWYNHTRIKQSLGYLSPVEYRQKLGLSA